MKVNKALDAIVARIAAIDVHLSGDDSPLPNPWEEIKDQLRSELSPVWPVYLATIKDAVAGVIVELSPEASSALTLSLRCSSRDRIEEKLLSRVLQRAKKEKVRYKPFDFSYFTYPLLDFTVYAKINERTGWESCLVTAYSRAAPFGEGGEVSIRNVQDVLTLEQFEKAREQSWPEQWEA